MCTVAVLGGTGTRKLVRGAWREELRVPTPYGPVSASAVTAGATHFIFVHRHGARHTLSPHEIRHEANISALKALGVRFVIGLSAVGGLHADLGPGWVVLLSGFISASREATATRCASSSREATATRCASSSREATATRCASSVPCLGAPPMVQHTDFSVPYCPIVRQALHGSIGFRDMYRQDGVLVGVTGPRYETPDEVRLFGAFGGDVVGMTGVPEAVAAREAGLCYAGLACVTNVGVGLSEGPIEHGQVTGAMQETVASLRDGIHDAVHSLSGVRPCTACR